jgi:hypothetical protein
MKKEKYMFWLHRILYKLWLLTQSKKYQKINCQYCDMQNDCIYKKWSRVCTYPYKNKGGK